MGYACPVCETPQQDAEHLANHLAFTAMLHGDAHEEWLDEHAPEWESRSPADLAERVADAAEETAYDAVFEDTVGRAGGDGHAHGDGAGHGHPSPPAGGRGPDVDVAAAERRGTDALDAEASEALAEARRMTRELLDARRGEGGGGDADGDDRADRAEGAGADADADDRD
jgi:hypothetical protein